MNRREIIEGINKYFTIEEFVDETTFNVHGERAWKFLDTNMLWFVLIVRENIGRPMTINNWKWGGKFSQRGLRTNICSIVRKKTKALNLYLSAHLLGKGVDFDVKGMKAEEVREWIQEKEYLFPFKIRLEWKFNKTGKPITWVHGDVFDEDKNPKIYLFNV